MGFWGFVGFGSGRLFWIMVLVVWSMFRDAEDRADGCWIKLKKCAERIGEKSLKRGSERFSNIYYEYSLYFLD